MGYYINPVDETKEIWLLENAERVDSADVAIQKTLNSGKQKVPVCLVDNGFFTAAAVGYSKAETQEFASPIDSRPKTWFVVEVSKLNEEIAPGAVEAINRSNW